MAGSISIAMMPSTATGDDDTLAVDRWNVEKKRAEWDKEFEAFRKKQRNRCKHVRITSNKAAVKMYERIFFTMRWSNPQLPMAEQELVLRFCDHYTGNHPEQKFGEENLLRVWVDKQRGTASEKINNLILDLCDRLKKIVMQRDRRIDQVVKDYHFTMEKQTIKKDSELRWTMEKNKGRRDRYWTIWYLSSHNMLNELKRFSVNRKLLTTSDRDNASVVMNNTGSSIIDINEKDPDFGLTALHYACKGNHLDVVSWLLEHTASESVRGPDGRTPLHYAAQYGNREIILLLLSHGADYYSVDDYGCTALDLAVQNKNETAIEVLRNWTKLLPPEDPPTPPPEEDLTGIPEEYLVTPLETLNAMSPLLQLLARRLDGQTGIEPASVNDQALELDGNGVPFLKEKTKRKMHSYGNKMDPLVEIRLCQKHSRLCFKEGMQLEGLKSMRRRWMVFRTIVSEHFEAFDPNAHESSNSGLNNLQFQPDESGCGRESLSYHSDLLSVMEYLIVQVESIGSGKSVLLDGTNPSASTSISPMAAYECAMELAEKLVELKQEGFATVVLRQCFEVLAVRPMECLLSDVSIVALQSRRCEILLFVYDALIAQNGVDSQRTVQNSAPDDKKRDQKAVTFNSAEVQECVGVESSTALLPDFPDKSVHMQTLEESPANEKQENQLMTIFDPNKEENVYVMNNAQTGELTDAALRMIVGDGYNQPSIGEERAMEFYGHEKEEEDMDRIIKMRFRLNEVLEEAQGAVEDAIRCHHTIHMTDIVEPVTLSPLLELLSNVFERKNNDMEALKVMKYAVSVCTRTLGKIHEESIRVMMETLRLQTRVADNGEGFREAARMATEISRYLDELLKENPMAAQNYLKKCAELLSLSTLLEAGKISLPSAGELKLTCGLSEIVGDINRRSIDSNNATNSTYSSKSGGRQLRGKKSKQLLTAVAAYGVANNSKGFGHKSEKPSSGTTINALCFKKKLDAAIKYNANATL